MTTTFSYNGHTYQLTKAGTWTEAQAEAQSLGGNLVTINDQAEQDWLISTFQNVDEWLWIGYTDQEAEGIWKWISGETSTYTHWSSGEPNNHQGNENYAHIFTNPETRANYWNDLPNVQSYHSMRGIIEFNTIDGTTSETPIKFNGGTGDDIYFVTDKGIYHSDNNALSNPKIEEVIEQKNEGTDEVRSSITYTLPANVENLDLENNDSLIDGYGNELKNVLTGNDKANQLWGYAGNDSLNGELGDDSLFGGDGNDTLNGGGSGYDEIDGGKGTDTAVIDGFFADYKIEYFDNFSTTNHPYDFRESLRITNKISYEKNSDIDFFVEVEKLQFKDVTADVSSFKPKPVAEIFKANGYYSTFADLAKAVYQLGSDEASTGQGVNFVKPYADEAWARVNKDWKVLTNDEITVTTGVISDEGIYHNANAAAIAVQCKDALVISIRGTNDNDAGLFSDGDRTPDVYDWTHMAEHYAKLKPFLDSVDQYVTASDIKNVYVTGHSLGGGMVLAYMLDHPYKDIIKYEAVTFAAPGYNFSGSLDDRIICIEMDGDPVPDTGYHEGRIVTVNSNLYHDNNKAQAYGSLNADYHSMDIYMEAAHSLDSQLPDTAKNGAGSIHGFNLNSFDINYETQVILPMQEIAGTQYTWDNKHIAPKYEAMTGDNFLDGTGKSYYSGDKNVMIGGVGNDTYDIDNNQDLIIEKANAGFDSVKSFISFVLPANVENLTLKSTSGADFDDFTATGNELNNTLTGNEGKNVLTGLAGKDTLTGGKGADTFKFNSVTESGLTNKTRDIITDFKRAEKDKIDLSAIDANTTTKANDAFKSLQLGTKDVVFKLTNALYFNTATHILYGNNDKDAEADFSIELSGVNGLVKSDFIL